jgi:hypothetical protein
LITSLPHALLLLLFSVLSALASLVNAASVLVSCSVPEGLRSFQRGLLEWAARVLVYHASLSEAYPRFSGSNLAEPPAKPGTEAHGGSAV